MVRGASANDGEPASAKTTGLVRSTHRGPVVAAAPPNYGGGEEGDDFLSWWSPQPEVQEYEDSLPSSNEDDWASQDPYEMQWDRVEGWLLSIIDDAPTWEREVWLPCAECGQRDDLDPLTTCSRCREDDGRCCWCGLDPVVYESDASCRTCYQRLRRTRVTRDLAFRLSMLDAAFKRSDLRKRRAMGL
jgi:hypothetical protein